MILILDTEIDAEYRYLGPEIQHHTPGQTMYHVLPEEPTIPDLSGIDGVILSGSTASVYDDAATGAWLETEYNLIRQCISEQLPLLGVCFGHQAINAALGGTVVQDTRRATFVEMEQTGNDQILRGVNSLVPVLHGDLVTEPGRGMVQTARTTYNDYFCTRHEAAPVWTVQFHPEFTPRVSDVPTDWKPGSLTFDEVNATTVFSNFSEALNESND